MKSEVQAGVLKFAEQENGWCNKDIAKKYLEWLRSVALSGDIWLLWDVFAAQRDEEVKQYAKTLRTNLIFIPAGMTDIYQPLDRYISGDLKQRAYCCWVKCHLIHLRQEMSMANSLKLLIEAWKSIDQETILHSWAHLTEM
jgi:hypothetical protein